MKDWVLGITRLDQHIKGTECRVVVSGLVKWIPIVGGGLTGRDSVRVPGSSIGPIFHPTSDIVYQIIHGTILIRFASIPGATIVTVGGRNLMLRQIVGTEIAIPIGGTPFVGDDFHAGVKGQRHLKQMLAKDFVQGTAGNGPHAQGRILQVVREISIGVNPIFGAGISKVSQGIG